MVFSSLDDVVVVEVKDRKREWRRRKTCRRHSRRERNAHVAAGRLESFRRSHRGKRAAVTYGQLNRKVQNLTHRISSPDS